MTRKWGLTPIQLAMAPAVVLLMVLFLFPLWRVVTLSLHAPEWSLQEFRNAFGGLYVTVMIRTFVISGTITLLCLLIAYPMAAFLVRLKASAQRLAMLCVILPFLTSLLVRSYGWIVLLGDTGAINSLLQWLGIIEYPLMMMYSRFGMMVGMVHVLLPFMVLPIYSAMRQVDAAQWRAARAMGAGTIRSFLTVYLPQTMRGVLSGCLLVAIIALGFYITPAMLGGGQDLMLSNLIANNALVSLNFPFAAALALVLLVATYVIYTLLGGGNMSVDMSTNTGGSKKSGSLLTRFLPLHLLSPVFAGISGRLRQGSLGKAESRVRIDPAIFLNVWGILVCIFLLAPSAIVLAASFSGESSLNFPPASWSTQWYSFLLADEQWRSAAGTSFRIALIAALLSVVIGSLAAYGIARSKNGLTTKLVFGLILAPMIVPSLVTAIGAFSVLTDFGLYGTEVGIALMHTCLNVPLVAVVMVGAFGGLDARLERAAASLGASRMRTARQIVLPLVAPAILSAAVFAFIQSFDEIVLTSFIVGTDIVTLPTKMWENIRNQVDPAVAALSSLLILIPVVAVVVMAITDRAKARRASA